jgi:hypothetical protein
MICQKMIVSLELNKTLQEASAMGNILCAEFAYIFEYTLSLNTVFNRKSCVVGRHKGNI